MAYAAFAVVLQLYSGCYSSERLPFVLKPLLSSADRLLNPLFEPPVSCDDVYDAWHCTLWNISF